MSDRRMEVYKEYLRKEELKKRADNLRQQDEDDNEVLRQKAKDHKEKHGSYDGLFPSTKEQRQKDTKRSIKESMQRSPFDGLFKFIKKLKD